ncbi:hypothetical protein BDL97_02G023100 [Sphagnum fallax]|nr:hypothetical protein BDL97_02G023100 [Sphagnum fallax]
MTQAMSSYTSVPPRLSSGSLRASSTQLLSPVWEEYVPPPFCGSKIDDPICSLAATKRSSRKSDHEITHNIGVDASGVEGRKTYSYDTDEKEKSIGVRRSSTSAAAASRRNLFAIVREKLLKWCSWRPIVGGSIHMSTRKPVKVSGLRRAAHKKKIAGRGRNNNTSRRPRWSRNPAHRHRRWQWTMHSMNPLKALAKLPKAYVNMMNGVASSAAFSSSPGLATFPTNSHEFLGHNNHSYHRAVETSDSDELIVKLLQEQLQRSNSSGKHLDGHMSSKSQHYATTTHQYYYHTSRTNSQKTDSKVHATSNDFQFP